MTPLAKARVVRVVSSTARVHHRCFSRAGWWQTLCGLDAANQGFGWSSDVDTVGCEDCLRRIENGEHETRPVSAYLKP